MSTLLKTALSFLGRMLLRCAVDNQLKQVIYNAVERASFNPSQTGQEKMQEVLQQVKASGVKALIHETESTLRAKIEQAKIDLKI